MPSYLILRILAFALTVFCPVLMGDYALFAFLGIPLTITHYLLALPYSKKHIVSFMSRPSTAIRFLVLAAIGVALAIYRFPYGLFMLFGIHYVFSEVYVMYENVMPTLWNRTRALRVASIFCNICAYVAAIRPNPLKFPSHQLDLFCYAAYVVSACFFVYQLFKVKGVLNRDQTIQACLFESLGLAFVIAGMMHPLQTMSFIFYHVVFWVFYPCSKMIEFKQPKALAIFLGSNIALTLILILLMPKTPFFFHLTGHQFNLLFTMGAIIHIVISCAMTTAQPAWITRIFHPGFARVDTHAPEVRQAGIPVPTR